MDILKFSPDAHCYIICDKENLEQEVLERVEFRDVKVEFLKSNKNTPELDDIVQNITEDAWRNAGYAHMTTFWHAKEHGYTHFWNIDADDTCICLSPERAWEMLSIVEQYVHEKQIDIISLDMWFTQTRSYHWSFGITYVDNTVDWFGNIRKHYKDEEMKARQPRNVDGYFSCLRVCTELELETFCFNNLKFIHYADDFFIGRTKG